ncbi:MAG TPA: M48 family metalloprotease, partial [Gemmatimonadales bacterium]|nr:M48 family metalloprotease [Gemmatimonadales bacterium]
ESQADQLGLRYMRRASYDPREMPGVFVMLDREGKAAGNAGRLPTWLATHPSPANRVAAISAQIAALPQDFSGTSVNRDAYERLLDGLVFGNNPRQGYFTGSQFFHPDLRFRIGFPDGWALNNGPQAVIAVSPAQDGVIELSQASEPTSDAAARAFLTQQGITSSSSTRLSLTGGLPAVSAPFAAATESGTLRGTVLFVEYGGAVYRIVGYAPEARWPSYQGVAEGAERSFQRLTDPVALNVQPQHMSIVTLARATTIAQLARERASPAAASTLALINQVEVDTPFASGRLVKWVIGLAPPIP